MKHEHTPKDIERIIEMLIYKVEELRSNAAHPAKWMAYQKVLDIISVITEDGMEEEAPEQRRIKSIIGSPEIGLRNVEWQKDEFGYFWNSVFYDKHTGENIGTIGTYYDIDASGKRKDIAEQASELRLYGHIDPPLNIAISYTLDI